MQNKDNTVPDPRAVAAHEAISEAATGLLVHCEHAIEKPYIAMFGMMMALSRIAVALSLDPRMLHEAIDAMYSDAMKEERDAHSEH